MTNVENHTYHKLLAETSLIDANAIDETLAKVLGSATEHSEDPVNLTDISAQAYTAPQLSAPNRLEISQLVRIEDQFSLFVLALWHMQQISQDKQESFFQIGGIHGQPYVPWPDKNVAPPPREPGQFGGYCAHRSVIFPTWHRPYAALYENIIVKIAGIIAEKYVVDKERWKKAAKNLRQPYWDWASQTLPPPEVIDIKKPRVCVIVPNGKRMDVPNPLLRYTFNPIHPSFTGNFSRWGTTLRRPDANGVEDIDALIRTLNSSGKQLKSQTWHMLTLNDSWPQFSNAVDQGSVPSLESIHNGIHVAVGGAGHMSSLAVASFDPIFHMHHTNVDRMLSLWSALNPGIWVTPGQQTGGTLTLPPGATIDEETDLSPFEVNSIDTRTTTFFSYTYPEFNGLQDTSPDEIKRVISRTIHQLYGGARYRTFAGSAKADPSDAKEKPVANPPSVFSHSTSNTGGTAEGTDESKDEDASLDISECSGHQLNIAIDWSVQINVQHDELGCSFSVPIFLGEVPEDPSEWLTCSSFVGVHSQFVNSSSEDCANCRAQAGVIVHGAIYLNDAIEERSGLSSLDPSVVEPYLKENLSWRVTKADGSVVDINNELKSLEVTVVDNYISFPESEILPIQSEIHLHEDITRGVPGGNRSV